MNKKTLKLYSIHHGCQLHRGISICQGSFKATSTYPPNYTMYLHIGERYLCSLSDGTREANTIGLSDPSAVLWERSAPTHRLMHHRLAANPRMNQNVYTNTIIDVFKAFCSLKCLPLSHIPFPGCI